MWELWKRTGARQEGESESAQPEPEVTADVPVKSNETDASSRGGGLSACSDRGGGEGKEGRTPDAQQDIAGPQEGKKWDARTSLNHSGVEGDGVRMHVRTYVCTYGWATVCTEQRSSRDGAVHGAVGRGQGSCVIRRF